MIMQSLPGVRLVLRPAVKKPGVFHYSVELGARTAALTGRHPRGGGVELKPGGVSVELFDTQSGWSPVAAASDEAGAIARLLEIASVGMTYDIVRNNCEHLARYVVTGKRESARVDLLALVAFGADFALLFCLVSEPT